MATFEQRSRQRRERKARKQVEARAAKGLATAFPAAPKLKKSASKTAGMSKRQRATYYERQAAANVTAAKRVDASGTGNKKASATHRSVAKQYVTKARALRKALAAKRSK